MSSPRAPDVLRMFEHLEPVGGDEHELPLLDAAESTTCSQCGAHYEESAFLALPVSEDGGVWKLEDVTLAIRRCARCSKVLGRRIA